MFVYSFTDINECQLPNSCGANTNCVNAPSGSYTCSCKDGYAGDPRVNCVGKTSMHWTSFSFGSSYIYQTKNDEYIRASFYKISNGLEISS